MCLARLNYQALTELNDKNHQDDTQTELADRTKDFHGHENSYVLPSKYCNKNFDESQSKENNYSEYLNAV
jgi:hypothetical protein